MRQIWLLILTGAILAAAAGCADSGDTKNAAPASASPSPSPSPTCDGVPAFEVYNEIRARSEWTTDGDLNVLQIAAGEVLCPARTATDGTRVISVTTLRYGAPRTRPKVAEKSEPVATYDGTTEVRVPIPVIGSPCLGVAVHVGTELPADVIPETPFLGTSTGTQLLKDMQDTSVGAGFGLGLDSLRNPLIGVDSRRGPTCTITIGKK